MAILRRAAAATRKRAWLLFLVGGGLAASAYALLPLDDLLDGVIYAGSTALASGMVFRAARRARNPQARRTFLLVGVAMLVGAVGSTIYQAAVLRGIYPAVGSVDDLFWLSVYPLLIVALLRLVRRQDRSYLGVLDVGVIAATFSIVVVAFFIEPYLASNASSYVVAVQSLYAVFDVIVLAAVIRIAISRARPAVGLRLFLLGIGAYLGSDFTWNWLGHVGTYMPGSWADCGWILSGALIAAASVHPSTYSAAEKVAAGPRFAPRRLLLPMTIGLAVYPIVALVPGEHGEGTIALVAAALIQVAFISTRLWLLLRESARSAAAERALTEQLVQSQKLAAVGQISAGIAHDFNNLLTVITLQSELLRSRLTRQHVDAGGVTEILTAAAGARDLTQQLLAFGRKQVLVPTATTIAAVLEPTLRVLRPLIDEAIEVNVTVAHGADAITCDADKIQQAFSNLILNARDAMPAGGTLDIRAAPVDVDVERAASTQVEPGHYLAVSFTDTGCGMDADTTARLFEPFFTTKPFGTSSGLGLSMVHGIIHQSLGFLDVTSAPGAGSVFTVHLPIRTVPAARPEAPRVKLVDTSAAPGIDKDIAELLTA